MLRFGDMVHRLLSKKKERTALSVTKTKLIDLISKNGITDIAFNDDDHLHHIGSTAEFERNSFKWFNRTFYIDEKEYESFDAFVRDLNTLFAADQLMVVSIDDMDPRYTNLGE